MPIAQLVERWIVVPVAVGSNPPGHPKQIRSSSINPRRFTTAPDSEPERKRWVSTHYLPTKPPLTSRCTDPSEPDTLEGRSAQVLRAMKMMTTQRITIEPGKRSGQPCIRGLRITVWDILSWLAAGMFEGEILDDYPELESEDFRAVYEFAARIGRRVAL